MNDIIKWVTKIAVTAVIWVFVLSITWEGKPLFNYANRLLVQNTLVQAIDEELNDLWTKFKRIAKATLSEPTEQTTDKDA